MGFNSVYKSLQEIFPQVDTRLLRAVAIEHPKDADMAAGIVLAEVIPLMSGKIIPPATSSHDSGPGALMNIEVMGPSSPSQTAPVQIVESTAFSRRPPLDDSTLSTISNANDSSDKFLEINEGKELNTLGNAEENITREMSGRMSLDTSNVDVQRENLITSDSQEMGSEETYRVREATLSNNNGNGCSKSLDEERRVLDDPTSDVNDVRISAQGHTLENHDTTLVEVESSVAEAVSEVQGHTRNARGSASQSEFSSGHPSTVLETLEAGCSLSKKNYSISEPGNIEDDFSQSNLFSHSNQVCRIDFLEEIIDEAKNHKKSLFSSMESLMNLMREVEHQEKAAEQARMEADRGALDILDRVEEMKIMLAHAKEANDMHAGEVYGEKAILATEMRELQSRLLSLSDERDNSLAVLDEMRQTLEARFAAAEELRRAAEQEKQGKEEAARKSLAEQEEIMEKVVRESKRLQQEAEENSKLREFLMDRGRVVDILQGEISVICQDVKLLKEKFDANLPLSKSLTSSQTSCILASSGSSNKSLASYVGSEHGDLSEIHKTSPTTSIDGQSSKSEAEDERARANHQALLDDEWDIFEKDVELNS
ncbi:hypothetical protein L6164_034576 [Bauhinia variegata]|uniref:Uncharacterized protein n=1 Tax=Bauhinia variegata TaxID=167791 RepID=A0ACB9KVZ1_BAUVA|nr:hypothetical protein L6164_034576 [Bauhinia variegata]